MLIIFQILLSSQVQEKETKLNWIFVSVCKVWLCGFCDVGIDRTMSVVSCAKMLKVFAEIFLRSFYTYGIVEKFSICNDTFLIAEIVIFDILF